MFIQCNGGILCGIFFSIYLLYFCPYDLGGKIIIMQLLKTFISEYFDSTFRDMHLHYLSYSPHVGEFSRYKTTATAGTQNRQVGNVFAVCNEHISLTHQVSVSVCVCVLVCMYCASVHACLY